MKISLRKDVIEGILNETHPEKSPEEVFLGTCSNPDKFYSSEFVNQFKLDDVRIGTPPSERSPYPVFMNRSLFLSKVREG